MVEVGAPERAGLTKGPRSSRRRRNYLGSSTMPHPSGTPRGAERLSSRRMSKI